LQSPCWMQSRPICERETCWLAGLMAKKSPPEGNRDGGSGIVTRTESTGLAAKVSLLLLSFLFVQKFVTSTHIRREKLFKWKIVAVCCWERKQSKII
jgi:hypothetical protein